MNVPQSPMILGVGRALALVLLATHAAAAQSTYRVNVDSAGGQANGDCLGQNLWPSISSDGQIVAFSNSGTNLVANDTNGKWDVFIHNRTTQVTERVSVSTSGVEGNENSEAPYLSADGNLAVFASAASNLIPGDTNGQWDIFVHNRSTGVTERVSVDSAGVESNGTCYMSGLNLFPRISGDGRFVVFTSDATNLVPNDTNGAWDTFVHDRSTGVTDRVSVDSSGAQADGDSKNWPSINSDGRYVVFSSIATNLVVNDTNSNCDVFVHDRSNGITERISVDSLGAQGNRLSDQPSVSADGQFVAFSSDASNLVANDKNGYRDVFVRDRSIGVTERISLNWTGQEIYDWSYAEAISADGRCVAVSSWGKLVFDDTNRVQDIHLFDRSTAVIERITVGAGGEQGTVNSNAPALSADGQVWVFQSKNTNFVSNDTNGFSDVFVRGRQNAAWSNYGTGFAGTNGIPSFTAQAPPRLGSTVTLDLGNSLGAFTSALVFFGFARANIPTSWGGELLVDPVITELIGVDASGWTITDTIPNAPSLIGITLNLQAFELDMGAARGMSFTPGLELLFGY